MPKEVSETWLWTAQNAFLAEVDPATGVRWKDRYGVTFGKDGKRFGNVEWALRYKKLHRTGRLLRGLKVKRTKVGNASRIILYNNVPYVSEHQVGGTAQRGVIRPPYVQGDRGEGVRKVVTGSNIHARPFMTPSPQILRAPYKAVSAKMKSFGW